MNKTRNPYAPIEAEVKAVVMETPTIKTLRLAPRQRIQFATGQFIELTVPGVGEAPFTPSSNPNRDDEIDISVMRVGKVTNKIHEARVGDRLGLRGPYGTGYPLSEFSGREVLIVGGGCGFAPLRSLIYELFNRAGQFKKLIFRGGCRSPKDFLYKSEIDQWARRGDMDVKLTVNVGDAEWKGNVGVVTTILDPLDVEPSRGVAIVCGPPVMMKFATRRLLELGVLPQNLYLSMEKNMSCGLGKCGHCRIGTFHACRDGPVFRYDRIMGFREIWE